MRRQFLIKPLSPCPNLLMLQRTSSVQNRNTVCTELSGVDQRCSIPTARGTGCKEDSQETLSGFAITVFVMPQPYESKHYHSR
ncbi:hypothetical protein TNCV_1265481 [Trichonephila clavipes]|nr:hypothetical protein TNCV_1265481 [Trichonephila clavipes]